MKRLAVFLKTITRLFFIVIFLTCAFTQVKPTSAQVGDFKRAEILRIAQRYASHSWTAADKNILHDSFLINAGVKWQVDTPDKETEAGKSLGGWWLKGTNTGIPYQWGGFSALDDSDLGLIADYGGYYDQQLSDGFAAGDISAYKQKLSVDGVLKDVWKAEYSKAAGIDCSGFVSRAWMMNAKQGTGWRDATNGVETSGLFKLSRPIKFEDLRPGDILNASGHVILFKEFLTPEKATANVTRFMAIEASGKDWKVGEKEYLLTNITEETEKWAGKSFTTNNVTIKWSTVSYTDYFPRTYITPIDVVLVIDRSGSMSGASINAAKNAAKLFVDLLRPYDKIGVVDFDDYVSVTYPLTEITSTGEVKTAAKNAINSLYARGATSIGGGLKKGMDVLNTAPSEDPVKIMVLLSDGGENTAPYAANVLPAVKNSNIVVHTIGLGYGANETLLQNIASTTGGVYRFSPSSDQLWQIYNSIANTVYGINVVRSASGTVTTGENATQKISIDSSIGSVTFSLFWPGSVLDLVLVQPDGRVITPAVADTDPHISFVSGSTYKYYQVDAPQVGQWTMRISRSSTASLEEMNSFDTTIESTGESASVETAIEPQGGLNTVATSVESLGDPYSIAVSASSGISLAIWTDHSEYGPGTPIVLTATIEDSFLDVTEHQYVLGATIQVVVKDPTQNQYQLELFDDGIHDNGVAQDGIYGNVFSNTSLTGNYNLTVNISGNNLRDGQPFTREADLSLVVSQSANQPPELQLPSEVSAQYSDELTFTVSATDPNDPRSSLSFSADGLPSDLIITDNHDGTATVTGTLQVAPGVYTPTITVTDPLGLTTSGPVAITVSPENAQVTYTGPLMVSTSSTNVSTAVVPLRATIQDITAIDPADDPDAGDIRNAIVTFVDRDTTATLCTANMVLLDPSDFKSASAACDWTANIGSAQGQDFTIGVVVGGYYTRNSSVDDAVVVISKPGTNFITGGGYIINQASSGKYAGDPNAKTNYGIILKFNNKLTNLQGRVNIIIRQNGHVYQIKSNNLTSLVAKAYNPSSPDSGKAELLTKASIQDITDPLNPVALVGGATLQVVMKDNGEPGNTDTIGVSVWDKSGKLLFSSNWTGSKTIPQVIGGGNIQVH